jgi:hypothetical protein
MARKLSFQSSWRPVVDPRERWPSLPIHRQAYQRISPPRPSRRALAGKPAAVCLASIKCNAGDSDAGYRLFKKGMQPQHLEGWIGLADAEADFALWPASCGARKRPASIGSTPRRPASKPKVNQGRSFSLSRTRWSIGRSGSNRPRVEEIEIRIAEVRR